jgi:hypothetical protein
MTFSWVHPLIKKVRCGAVYLPLLSALTCVCVLTGHDDDPGGQGRLRTEPEHTVPARLYKIQQPTVRFSASPFGFGFGVKRSAGCRPCCRNPGLRIRSISWAYPV